MMIIHIGKNIIFYCFSFSDFLLYPIAVTTNVSVKAFK